MDASSSLSGGALSFTVIGEGVSIDPATGALSIATDKLLAGAIIAVTVTNSGGSTVGRFQLKVTAAEMAPALIVAPRLVGAAKIGATVTADLGQWSGVPAPDLAPQWLASGREIPGAVKAVYVPVAADDTRTLACRVTARNPAGTAEAVTSGLIVSWPAPVALGGLADLVLQGGAAPATVAAAAAFKGAALTFAVSGGGATIDSGTGLVTIPTHALLDERITVTAKNSGGSAATGFRVAVKATAPKLLTAPTLAGSGRIGTQVVVDPGSWAGVPAPTLALQWLRDGVEIAGATGASYVPRPADDKKALSARVTATNPAGKGTAVTKALPVTQAPPAVVAALPAIVGKLGGPALEVEAAAAFTGEALSFQVAGAGAGIDPDTGLVTVPTGSEIAAKVTVTATNSGGKASVNFPVTIAPGKPVPIPPLVVTPPKLPAAARIGKPVTVDLGVWNGVPAPVLALQWLRGGVAIAGATAASYVPRPGDDKRALSVRVTATNAAGSATAVTAALTATYEAPVAKGGLPEEIFDVGSGPQTVNAAADFVGENLRFTVTGAGATVDPATGLVTIPTDAAVSATVTVTATNSGGSAKSAFRVTVEAEESDDPFALEAEDVSILSSVWRPAGQETWFTPTLRFPGLAGETVDAIEWTTSTTNPVPASEFNVVKKTGDAYQLYMRDPARNRPGAVPRVDFSVWKLDEPRRHTLRFRWRRTAQGPWSPLSPKLSVPGMESGWVPMITRTKGQFEAKEIGGPGMQFLRDFATSPAAPNLLLCPMDQNFPWASDDFGKSFYTPNWNGMWVGRSGVSAWIDPQDASRQLLLYSAGSQYFDEDFDAYSGLYRSVDGGKTAERVLSLPLLTGTTTARHNMRLIAHAPGGTPDTRTIYVMQVSHGPSGPETTTIQLWVSSKGGAAGSWSKRGSALPPATYADGKNAIWGIAVAPNGDLYAWGEKGAWRSPASSAGLGWTRLSSLPAKSVHHMDTAHGKGVVWAAVEDSGLYKAPDGATFTRNAALGAYKAINFGISPADRQYMVITGKGEDPMCSHDGGASWKACVVNPAIGQDDNFSHKMQSSDHYGLAPKVDDRMVWFAHRNQHMGRSDDGGRTWEWTGKFYDGSHTHCMGFHPTDWLTFAQAQQDRGLILTQTGGDYWLNDSIGGPKDGPGTPGYLIVTAIDNDQHISGAGTLIHASGRVVTLQGNSNGNRALCILQRKGGDPIGDTLVRTDCVSNLSGYASLDPNNPNSAFVGKYRLDNLNAAAMDKITCAEMTHHFVGASGAGGKTMIYGCVKDKADKRIFRSTDRGGSWSLWHTAEASFRPVDVSPVLAVSPHDPARVYAVSGAGKVVRIEDAKSPAATTIFDARTYLEPGHPKYAIASIALDSFDENLIYVSLFMWGTPNVFRSTDRGATWSDISGNVPSLDGVLFVHPLTSDLFFGSSHGTHVLPPPEGHRKTYGITNSVYDRVRAYVEANR